MPSTTLPQPSTVINFDNLRNGDVVSNQYAAEGITFDQSPSGPFGYKPTVVKTAAARSQPNVLDIEEGGFCGTGASRVGLWAHLSAPRNDVSMYVGDIEGGAERVTLVGYDMNGNPIPGATDTVNTAPTLVSEPMSITDPGGRISFFQVQGPPTAECLSVDDVGVGSQAPDTIAVTNPGTLNSYAGFPVIFQITAASNYGYPLTYHATGLPPGLGITSTGRILGTPQSRALGDWLVTVTATDTHGTRGSATFTWTITKLPICKPTTCS